MKDHEPKILVSSDIVGLLGNPCLLKKIYGEIFSSIKIDWFVELLLWQHLKIILNDIKNNLGVVGAHGPLGSVSNYPLKEKPIHVAYDGLMMSMLESIKFFEEVVSNNNGYVLVHEPEMARYDWSVPCNGTHVLVENIPKNGSMDNSFQIHEVLKRENVSAGLMIDLVHLLKEISGKQDLNGFSPQEFSKLWTQAMILVGDYLKKTKKSGLHIPIGSNFDSLPLEIMTNAHWKDLAMVIAENREIINWLVLENQHSRTKLRIWKRQIPELVERTHAIVMLLVENEVIPVSV